MKSKKMFVILSLLGLFVASIPTIQSKASTSYWSVYYVKNGTSQLSTTSVVYTSGGGYVATCSNLSGDCLYRTVTITSNYALNKTVAFSTTGSIQFNTTSMPTTTTISFYVTLSCSNGSNASAVGSIYGR